ncbi:SusC/RagA family TonB-linked outer membrane protein [Pedobacter sp. MC2016-05]|uniref:SusC/RagA family TonB-linked outer membrane protein n=1 Tax=Pedobacter sp. MC2016-05 TaxID=2994474 RepID=UPI00224747B6|nr:SusC/RagA family TonB-linked outer membrane protein [Pedobacter sp. MC2016-05]MCX2475385.1 SusC/RagA family TonB-linked outer membrane protein [Pedobacter sp. MC2016-05]
MTKKLSKPVYLLVFMLLLCAPIFKIHAQERNISVEAALNAISKKYKTIFSYENEIIEGKTTNINSLKAKSLDEALKNVLYNNNLLFLYVSEGNYTIVSRDDKILQNKSNNLKMPDLAASSEELYIYGEVLDETGTGLPGVTIKSDGANRVTITDRYGKFAMFVTKEAKNISFSYLGYQTLNQSISAERRNLKIRMSPSQANQLQDVDIVVNGYQALPQERSTAAASVIKAADIEKIKSPNLVQRLENQVAGLKVDLNSDNLFTYGNTQVAINSGTRSLGRTDYSMSIRGASTIRGETFPLVVVDGAISELDLSTLNPNDIANITFLKDAAAASIWGTRAANGVIVVTTKKGIPNQAPKVSLSVSATVANKPNLAYLKLMNSSQTIAYEQDLIAKNLITVPNASTPLGQPVSDVTDLTFKLRAGSITQADYNAAINRFSAIDSRDQISEYLLRPSSNQQYDLSVSGGGKSSDYFYSASYSRENPYSVGVNGQRLTVTLNNNFKLLKIATLSTNIKGSFFKFNNNGQGISNLFAPSATTFMPYNQLIDESGNRVGYSKQYYSGWVNQLQSRGYVNWRYNALDELDNANNRQNDNNYTVNMNLNVPVFKGLSANAFFGTERSFSLTRNYFNEQTYEYRSLINNYTPQPTSGQAVNSIGLANSGGILRSTNTNANNYTLRGQLNYDNTFSGKHQLTMIAGSEIRQTRIAQENNTLYGYNTGTGLSRPVNFFTPYATLQGFSTSLTGSPSQQDRTRRYLSYYSNAAYSFLGRYTLSGSVRYDDYNNFGVDRKFRATPLWSSGLKWDIRKESFLDMTDWLSSLSVRATYGVNGNISTQVFPFTYIALFPSDIATGLPSAGIISPANPELRWEKTYVANFGLDFGLFNSRLTGSLDIYTKRGKDLFYEFPINGTYGITTLFRNSTALSGNGVELSLRGTMIKNGNFEWSSGLNFAYNNNEVTDTRFALNSTFFSNPAYASNLNGYPTDKMFVYKNAGLDAAGLTQIFNEKGDKVSSSQNITSVDALSYAGRRNAPYFGNFNTNFRYKNLTLMAIASYQFGNVFLRPTISAYPTARTGVRYDLHEDVAKRWTKPGDEATTNVPGAAGIFAAQSLLRYQQSDINVIKGDYVRLRELSLSYQLPVEKITNFIRSANFAFSVRNLGILWRANKEGLDPDFVASLNTTSVSLPSPVSYNFSLNVNF